MGVTPRGCVRRRALCTIGFVVLAGCGSTGLDIGGELGSRSGGQFGDGGDLDAATGEPMAGRRSPRGGSGASPRAGRGGAAGDGSPIGSADGGRPDGGFGTGGSDGAGSWRDGGVLPDGGIADGGFLPDGGVLADGGIADGGFLPDGAAADGGGNVDGGPLEWCRGETHRGDLYITTKGDLERMRGCKTVNGNLFVTVTDADDLAPLEALQSVTGTLQLGPGWFNERETSLKGLENLTRVGSLEVQGAGISTLEPLANLQHADYVNIQLANRLKNLAGLGKLEWTNLFLTDNSALETLEGLHVPERVEMMMVTNLPVLASLAGLRGLKSVSHLEIREVPALATLDGLQDLEEIRDGLMIYRADKLVDLTGLGGLAGSVVLESNAELRTLAGHGNRGTLVALGLANNPKLESLAGGVGTHTTLDTLALFTLPSLTSLAGLEALTGIQTIGIATCDGLTSLAGLSGVTNAGDIIIEDSRQLQSLAGLDNLETVAQGLRIHSMPALTSLAGMPKLKQLRVLSVANTSALTNLAGFPPISSLEELHLTGNLRLATLTGLENLTEATHATIDSNPALTSLAGFGVKRSYVINIAANPQLVDLQLSSLTEVNELAVTGNQVLAGLTGLSALATVHDLLSVLQNPSLTSLRALSALTQAGALSIVENRRLPQCEVDWLSMRVNQRNEPNANGPLGPCPQ